MAAATATRQSSAPLIFSERQQHYDLSNMVPPPNERAPFMRIRMSSSASNPGRRSRSYSTGNIATFFATKAYHHHKDSVWEETTATNSADGTSPRKAAEFKIVDHNPYADMFRESINGCKKCNGDGIVIPKNSNEPAICPKCNGHGYDTNQPHVVMQPINGCSRCLVM
mmetsp:Transcript_44653/g.71470  ORF Transcript_44653/g.71470 Transcript_44653/m.71470 type:complete len:168 (-) Transcript_44653:9-512(-)